MCLLIWKPAGVELPEAHIRAGFHRNNDGGGLAWVRSDKPSNEALTWDKGFFGPAGLDAMVKTIKEIKDFPAMVHFRIRTHGFTDKANCHPHYLGGDDKMIWMLGHNGMLNCVEIEGNESDTAAFARVLKEKLVTKAPRAILSKDWQEMTAKVIGSGNKMLFLNNFGQHVIINESAGVWDGGVWYSNHSFRPATTTVQSTPVGGYRGTREYSQADEWGYYGSNWTPINTVTPAQKGIDGQFLPSELAVKSKEKKQSRRKESWRDKLEKHQDARLFPVKEPESEKWELSASELRGLEAEAEVESIGTAVAIDEAYEESGCTYVEVDLKNGCTFCGGAAGRKFVVFLDGSLCCASCEHDYRERKRELFAGGTA